MITKNILHSCNKEGFKEDEVYGAYKIFFGTLVSHSRLKIINALRNGPHTVSELVEKLAGDQTSVSHDLARLKKCGFVTVAQKGKFRYYRLHTKTIGPLMDLIDSHMGNYCIHILHDRDARRKKDEKS